MVLSLGLAVAVQAVKGYIMVLGSIIGSFTELRTGLGGSFGFNGQVHRILYESLRQNPR